MYVCILVYVCMYVCMYVCTYTGICMYVHVLSCYESNYILDYTCKVETAFKSQQ